jgi:predicted transcriptional regulator
VPNNNSIEKQILNTLSNNCLSIKDIVSALNFDAEKIIEQIDYLVRTGKISISESGKVEINK